MPESTGSCLLATSPLAADLSDRLGEHVTQLLALVAEFGRRSPTPTSTFAFEKKWPRCCALSAGMSSIMC
jgi:hypothetical protein